MSSEATEVAATSSSLYSISSAMLDLVYLVCLSLNTECLRAGN